MNQGKFGHILQEQMFVTVKEAQATTREIKNSQKY